MVYSTNNLKDTKQRPSNKDPIYSAFRGPNPIETRYVKTYKGQELFDEEHNVDFYNPDEPLYLYHGPRLCVEKTTDDENKTLIADSLFRPKRKYFDPNNISYLLDENDVKSEMSKSMLRFYSNNEDDYKRCAKDPKFLYIN